MKSSKRPSKTTLINQLLTRGVDSVIERKHLERALKSGRRLRVKLGIDATAPDLHLGNAVVLRKLKAFQDLGHKVVFIIGDFTTQVGDPSGQSGERKVLTQKEIERNMKKYLSQAGKVINIKSAEVRYNSEWLGRSVGDLLELAKAATINQVSERADFRDRIKRGYKVTFLEAFYGLLQGYDSVNVKADVELGGTDQFLNLLMGRQVQRHFGQKEQDILTVPLLEGTDGRRKMSKSYDNCIGLDDSPKNMFGKIMSVRDNLIVKYFILCTDDPRGEKELKAAVAKDPMGAKMELADRIVTFYHSERAAGQAKREFTKVFSQKGTPSRISTKSLPKRTYILADLLVAAGLASSKGDARRLITQGGVRVEGKKEFEPEKRVKLSNKPTLFQVGKRKFLKLTSK